MMKAQYGVLFQPSILDEHLSSLKEGRSKRERSVYAINRVGKFLIWIIIGLLSWDSI